METSVRAEVSARYGSSHEISSCMHAIIVTCQIPFPFNQEQFKSGHNKTMASVKLTWFTFARQLCRDYRVQVLEGLVHCGFFYLSTRRAYSLLRRQVTNIVSQISILSCMLRGVAYQYQFYYNALAVLHSEALDPGVGGDLGCSYRLDINCHCMP